MRVSTSYQFEAYRGRTEKTGNTYFEAQMQVSSGKRISKLSDDPNGAVGVISMRSLKSGIEQYTKNTDRAKSFMGLSEKALGEMNTLVTRANALTVSGGTATASKEQQRVMAEEVATIRDRVFQLANSKSQSGEFLFGGTVTDVQPFKLGATGVTYQGNVAQMRAETAPGQQTNMSLNAGTMFTDLYNNLDKLKKSLETGDLSQLTGQNLTDMQGAVQQINSARGELGVRMRDIENTKNDHARRKEELTSNISDIEDVDLSQAITDYKKAETAYQASLQVAGQGYRMSLMDYIRG
jgi:flagellar hook-associated protein 3 FlgL